MTREDIIRMAADSNLQLYGLGRDWEKFVATLERFADLVAAAERERIITANAPEIEKVNAHIKALEDAVAAIAKAGEQP